MEDAVDLKALETKLENCNWLGGDLPGPEDYEMWEKLKGKEPDQNEFINLWTWWTNTFFFTDEVKKTWKEVAAPKAKGKGPAPQKKAEPKKEEKHKGDDDDDDMDLFGSDDDDAEEVAAALKKKKEEAIRKAKEKASKVVGKSMVVFDVKPWEAEQDLNTLAAKVLEIEMEGLTWGGDYKLVDVAYGIKKLQVVCSIVDTQVSTDDLIEKIEAFEDEVQSVDIVSFNKI